MVLTFLGLKIELFPLKKQQLQNSSPRTENPVIICSPSSHSNMSCIILYCVIFFYTMFLYPWP